jgi:hypothetical protein
VSFSLSPLLSDPILSDMSQAGSLNFFLSFPHLSLFSRFARQKQQACLDWLYRARLEGACLYSAGIRRSFCVEPVCLNSMLHELD